MRAAVAILVLVVSTASAQAATITVTSASGGHNDTSACVLRDAINAANNNTPAGGCTAGSGNDVIELPAHATIILTEQDQSVCSSSSEVGYGLPSICAASTIEIFGNGATIQRNPTLGCTPGGAPTVLDFALFRVRAGGVLHLHDLTLANGCASGNGSFSDGGAIYAEGLFGLHHVTVSNNTARFVGGALYIANGSGFATIDASAFSGNDAGNAGGAIDSEQSVDINTTLFTGNRAGAFGGSALYLGAGNAQIANSTISGNSASNGAAILNGSSGNVSLVAVTVSDNLSQGAMTGGVQDYSSGTMLLKNTLLSANTPTNCTLSAAPYTDFAGANLSSDASCTGFTIENANALLGPLADNGGPSRTRALSSGSPAIDATPDCTGADGVTALAIDQRYHHRPFAAACDLGAYERDDTIFADGFDVVY